MRVLTHNKSSTYLIVLSAVILSLGIVMSYLVHVTVKNLQYDAGLINQAGIVRGSIQRVAKLVLSDSTISVSPIIKDINHSLNNFESIENGFSGIEVDETVFNGVQKFRQKWQGLEVKLLDYTTSSSAKLRQEIIQESEECWEVADAIVLAVQQASEDKVAGIRLFYVILLVNAVSALFVIWLIISYVRKILEYEAVYDHLTRIRNRRSYDNTIEAEINRSGRYEQPMSLVLFDVDNFKGINDEHGHKLGDVVLVTIAKVVTESIRLSDAVFRMGGDEFAIIIPGVEVDGAFKLAEKIRTRVASRSFGIKREVTLSLGIAGFHPDITKDGLYHNADKALYLAKDRGRNCTVLFSGDSQGV